MVIFDTFTRRYTVVCGNQVRYADGIAEAAEILSILEFGEKLKKLLDKALGA